MNQLPSIEPESMGVITEKLTSELTRLRVKPMPQPVPYSTIEDTVSLYRRGYDRILFAWLYLSGQRISEALSLKRSDLSTKDLEGDEYIIADSITLKNPNQPRRRIPIPLKSFESKLALDVWTFFENLRPELRLFTYSRQTSFNHLSEVSIRCDFMRDKTKERFEGNLAIYPHYLRHCRASHLTSEYGYDLRRLMQFFGWSSPYMPNLYTAVDWRDLARGFK